MRRVGCGALVMPSRLTPVVMLNRFGDRVRCINSYLCGAKVAPWRWAQVMQPPCTCSRTRQLLSVLLPTTKMLTSSTKPMADTLPVPRAQKSTRSLLKNRNRIGETGDPRISGSGPRKDLGVTTLEPDQTNIDDKENR